MNVACSGCGTRYAVADEKVRGRRVRIACKHCSTLIVVDGMHVAQGASGIPKGPNGHHHAIGLALSSAPCVDHPSPSKTREIPGPANRAKLGMQAASKTGTPQSVAAKTAVAGTLGTPVAAPGRAPPVNGPKPIARTTAAQPKSNVPPEQIPSQTRTLSPPARTLDRTAIAGATAPGLQAADLSQQTAARRDLGTAYRSSVKVPAIGVASSAEAEPSAPLIAARRPPRALRETIIGVAAPANSPANLDRAPTGVIVPSSAQTQDRGGMVVPDKAPNGAALGPAAPPRAARNMRQTIIGVAAPANAPNTEPVPAPGSRFVPPAGHSPEQASLEPPTLATGKVTVKPNLKRTIIGGLDAAPGSAPAPRAVGLGIPTELKWNVLIPKRGAIEMTAPDIVRAFAEGKLSRDNNVWREGLEGWQPLGQVESLRILFVRAGISLDPPPSPDPRPSPSQAPAAARTPASTDPADQLFDADDADGAEDEVTRIAASPWEVPDVGTKAAERLASSAGLPSRQHSVAPSRPAEAANEAHSLPERPSRRPDIGPRATVRGQLAAISSAPPRERQPLPQPRIPKPANAPTTARAASDTATATTRPPPSPTAAASTSTAPSVESAKTDSPEQPALALDHGRSKNSRRGWWIGSLLILGLSASLTVCYRTKQPHAAYAYLHRRGWDVAVDHMVKQTGPALHRATESYVVRPYRAVAQKLRHTLKK
jgi:predicted Zn finger-like uncharacterized protein